MGGGRGLVGVRPRGGVLLKDEVAGSGGLRGADVVGAGIIGMEGGATAGTGGLGALIGRMVRGAGAGGPWL